MSLAVSTAGRKARPLAIARALDVRAIPDSSLSGGTHTGMSLQASTFFRARKSARTQVSFASLALAVLHASRSPPIPSGAAGPTAL